MASQLPRSFVRHAPHLMAGGGKGGGRNGGANTGRVSTMRVCVLVCLTVSVRAIFVPPISNRRIRCDVYVKCEKKNKTSFVSTSSYLKSSSLLQNQIDRD